MGYAYGDGTAIGYPAYFYECIRQDDCDILMEMWPVMEPGVQSDYTTRSGVSNIYKNETNSEVIVNKGNFIGIIGQIDWFVPKYAAEMYPELLLPSKIMHDPTVRELLINGSRNGNTLPIVFIFLFYFFSFFFF